MGVTIREVARRAGVSTATVSRVLSGASGARPGTAAAVREAAETLDYRPSSIARSLKTRTTGTLGLIVTDVINPFFPELVRAVEDAAWEHGLRILLCNGARDPRREADYLTLLQERRVDGLIVAAGHLTDEYAARLAATSVPVVIVNSEREDVGVPSIVSDNRAGGRLAAQHLLALGHRRIAVVIGPPEHADAMDRVRAALDMLVGAGIAREDIPVIPGIGSVAPGDTIAGLLAARPDISAMICFNDVTAIEVIRLVRAAGRRIPADISVIGFDDIDAAAWIEPPLTTVAQRTAEMGRWAVGRLVEMVARGERSRDAGGKRAGAAEEGPTSAEAPERVVLPVSLRVRGSTGPAPRGPGERASASHADGAQPALLRRPTLPGPDGTVHAISPTAAGWTYVEFAVHRLDRGASLAPATDGRERIVLVLEGHASVQAGNADFGIVGSRDSVFDGPPPPVILVAPQTRLRVVADDRTLVAIASAPGGPVHRTALVPPDEILVEQRGSGQTARRIHHLLPPAAEAGRLIAFEVFTPAGNWSSYPPHKHDTEDPPREALLEELYFYRFAKPQGFAVQRVYTPDGSIDQTITARDLDVVLVPAGYHPVAAAPGYACYYLNVMAGPNRAWHFTVDPDHSWLMDWNPTAPRTAVHEEASR